MWVTDGLCLHGSYAVTLLRSYDKVVAAIKDVGVAAIKEVDAAAGARGHGRLWPPQEPREPRAGLEVGAISTL